MKPSQLSRLSFTFAAFKRFSAIHPPLPLTPLQSEKLLGLIKDSFRQQLAASAHEPSKAGDPNNVTTPPDSHLSDVLQAPVFAASHEEIKHRQEDRIKRFLVDPIGVFEEHATLGTANLHLAASCLRRYESIRKQDGDCNSKGDASMRVLKGLKKAGLVKDGAFLRDRRFVFQLVHTLEQEGRSYSSVPLRYVAWESLGPDVIHRTIEPVAAAVETIYSREDAVKLFLSFVGKMVERHAALYSVRSVQMIGIHLLKMGRKHGNLGESTYQRLLQNSVYWAADSVHPMVQLRFGGDTNPAIEYFTGLDVMNKVFWETAEKSWLRKNALIGLEIASQCLKQGNTHDAHRIVAILKRRFAGKVGGLDVESFPDQDSEVVGAGFLGQLLGIMEQVRSRQENSFLSNGLNM
ncbi:hypothetical protein RUND412_002651 [Rhizina undulata]